MSRYKVKDNDFVEPFYAETEEQAAGIAIKLLGFGHCTKEDVASYGSIHVLKHLDYSVEITSEQDGEEVEKLVKGERK
ncbi:MAG: hypothetical protein ACTSUP_08060 [Candidatus Heimdallarchaeaceae archaeon]